MDPAPEQPPPVESRESSPPRLWPGLRLALLIAAAVFGFSVLTVILSPDTWSWRMTWASLVVATGWRFAVLLGLLVAFGLPPMILAWLVRRAGHRRGWPAHQSRRVAVAAVVALVVIGGVGSIGWAWTEVRQSSKLKAMIPRQMAAAADQYALENGYAKIFIRYEDLVGAQAYIKAQSIVDGEDPRAQFPIRMHWGNPFKVRLPDGTTVERSEVFAVVSPRGLVATYPSPHEGHYDSKRVYLLPDGTTFRNHRIVNRRPDPAGMEGRDQDGVHVYDLGNNSRYEITYRAGMPDGPFRAYRADGSLWVEATYVKGHVVGPAWHHLPGGRKFDELAVGAEEATRLLQRPN